MSTSARSHGFQRVQRGYSSAGQHFWSPEAYEAGMRARRLRTPLGCLAVAAAVGAGVAVFLRVRRWKL